MNSAEIIYQLQANGAFTSLQKPIHKEMRRRLRRLRYQDSCLPQSTKDPKRLIRFIESLKLYYENSIIRPILWKDERINLQPGHEQELGHEGCLGHFTCHRWQIYWNFIRLHINGIRLGYHRFPSPTIMEIEPDRLVMMRSNFSHWEFLQLKVAIFVAKTLGLWFKY